MWLYKDKQINELTDMPEHSFGFIYEVTHLPTGRKYLGKKQLISVTTKALGKKELAQIVDKRASKKKKVTKESDWKTYYGSHPEIKQLIKEQKQSEFSREILIFTPNKKLHTYYENKFLFINVLIEPDSNYIIDSIEGIYVRIDFL